jgi:succinoglycan biosynthesis transport protein ExoP
MKNLEDLTVRDYFSIFLRRIVYFIVTTVLVAGLSLVYVRRMPSFYRSSTMILVTGQVVPEDYIRSIENENSNEIISFIQTQVSSRTFAERIVRDFQLAVPEQPDRFEAAINSVRGNIELVALSPTVFRIGYLSQDPATALAVTKRLGEMVVELNDSSRKERVHVADSFLDEQESQAETGLAEAEAKLSQFRNQHFPGLSTETVNLATLGALKAQLATINSSLDALIATRKSLEQRLVEQRMLASVLQTPSLGPEPLPAAPEAPPTTRSPLEETLAKRKEEYEQALKKHTPDYPGVTALAEEIKSLEASVRNTPAKAVNVTVAPSTVTRTTTPDEQQSSSVALFEFEVGLQKQQLEKEISRVQADKKALETKISLYEYTMNPPRDVAQELAAFERDDESAKRTYQLLRDKKLNMEMTARVATSDKNGLFKVIDPAFLPQFPSGPNRTLYNLAGGLAAVFFGLGAVFVREYLDPTLQNADEAAAELGLPVLSCVPKVSAAKDTPSVRPTTKKTTLNLVAPMEPSEQVAAAGFSLRSVDPCVRRVVLDPVSEPGEQFRMLRATFSSLQKERRLKTVLIASGIPNEGKTFVASCLAGILAQEPGKKVLLVDADLHTATAGSIFGIGRGQAGLTDLIRGAPLEQCLMKCAEINLSVLPAGELNDKPADLLSSPELERQLRQVSQLFDWVIIDSPPVLVLADAKIIAPLCDTALFVVNCAKTPKTILKEAIQRIGREHFSGIVLNRVRKVQSLGYYSYYHEQPLTNSKK